MKKIFYFIFIFLLMLNVANAAAPKMNSISDKNVFEGEELVFDIIASPTDSNDIFFSFVSRPDTAYYSLPYKHNAVLRSGADAVTKEFHWTPEIGWAGVYELRFIVSDGTDFTYQDVVVTVDGVNHAPDMLPMDDLFVVWENELLFDIPVEHLDIHDDLEFSGNLKIGNSFSSGFNSFPSGVELNSSSGRFTWTPNVDDNLEGDYYFRFCVTDGDETDCEYTTVTIVDNYPPSFNFVPEQITDEGVELTVYFNLTDFEDSVEDLDFVIIGDLPEGVVFAENKLVWTPTYQQAGEYLFGFELTDTFGNSYRQDVLIVVLDVELPATKLIDGVAVLVDEITGELVFDSDVVLDDSNDFRIFDNSEALNFVVEKNIFTGDSDTGDFALERGITRVELVKVLLSAFSVELQPVVLDDAFVFTDLISGEWYMDYVYTAFRLGFMTGYSDEIMRPSRVVNRVEFLRMLSEIGDVELQPCTRNLYSDVSVGDWYCKYVNFAVENDFLDGDAFGEFNPGYKMKRGDVIELLYAYYQIFGF